MSFRVHLEIIRAISTLLVLLILLVKGKPLAAIKRKGYNYIITGFILIVFAAFLDITDNFPSLDKYIVIGNTPIQAILEKVVGYLFGFIFISIGFWEWLPGISELKKTQERLATALEQEEHLFKELQNEKNQLFTTLHSIGDGVISTDRQGKVVMVNPTAEKMTGWPAEEAIGKHIEEIFRIVNEETGETLISPIEKVLSSGKVTGVGSHSLLISKGGGKVNIADSASPVRNADGDIIGVVLVFRDASSEKELFDEKLRSQKLDSIGVLAGGIAHDFNNLLMGIQGNISLALMADNLTTNVLDLLRDADKATKRASHLTHQLLTFSKGGDPSITEVAIDRVVMDSANFIVTGSDVKCKFDVADDLWVAKVDKGQISQVVENITLNARQAMSEGGTIEISLSNVESKDAEALKMRFAPYICIRIKDSGNGIRRKDLSRIFDPYFTTKKHGSGIGLATCFSIIRKHGGRILVDSEEGVGTVFSVYIPAERKSVRETGKQKIRNNSSGSVRRRVLIMDDEIFIRKLLFTMLEKLGYDVVVARDGDEAIAIYRNAMESGEKIDIVMLDLTIPGGKGGEETAGILRKMDPGVTMIVVSGYADSPVLSKYRDYGFAAALPKPFNAEDLKSVLLPFA